MLTAFDWKEVYLMAPDRRLRSLAGRNNWKILSPETYDLSFPEGVHDYATRVVRSSDIDRHVNFYLEWENYFYEHNALSRRFVGGESIPEAQMQDLRNLLAIAGLWLKEDDEITESIRELFQSDFETSCFGLYRTLLERTPEGTVPLRASLNR
jgi:hypothetical protein